MILKRVYIKFINAIHRFLLNFIPYKKLLIHLGMDSSYYKRYYKNLYFEPNKDIAYSDVDGYYDEGDYEKVVCLVDHILGVVKNPRNVLDIGCGTGRYLKRMSELLPQTHFEGIDISEEIVLKFTKKQIPHIKIHILDIENDRTFCILNKERFDLVCMIGIVQVLSVRKIESILKKIHRLCCENGVLYIQFNVETEDKTSTLDYKRYSIEALTGILNRCSFNIVKSGRTDVLRDYAFIFAQKTGK